MRKLSYKGMENLALVKRDVHFNFVCGITDFLLKINKKGWCKQKTKKSTYTVFWPFKRQYHGTCLCQFFSFCTCLLWTCYVLLHVFFKHIKIQGLGLDMLETSGNIGWKSVCDILILVYKMLQYGRAESLQHY